MILNQDIPSSNENQEQFSGQVKYLKDDYGLRQSLLESFDVTSDILERPEASRLHEKGYRVRDKRPVALEKAMLRASVQRDLVLKGERTSGF